MAPNVHLVYNTDSTEGAHNRLLIIHKKHVEVLFILSLMSLRRLTYQLSSPSKIPPQILGGWGLYSQKGIMMYRKLFKRLPDRLAEAYIDFYFTLECISMTTVLTHTVAHFTKPSFRSKTNNQPLKKFLSLALS